jgi:hypothetical protein
MIRRSATQQNLSNDMIAETVQQFNHVFSLPTGPAIRTAKRTTNTAPFIITSECPDTVKPLNNQKLITMLRYKIRWMRSTAN